MPFLSLPNEIILRVLGALATPGDVYALLRANRRLSVLAAPFLRCSMLTSVGHAALAILWAAATRNTQLLADVLENSSQRIAVYVDASSPPIMSPHRCDDATLAVLVRDATTLQVDWSCSGTHPTALCQAVEARNTPLVRVLLERGANPNPAREGPTALHYAASLQQSSITRLLLANGANNAAVGPAEMTPLHLAVWAAGPLNTDVARALLEAGADPDTRGPCGATALHFAIGIQSVPDSQVIVGLLLEYGADPTLANHSGETALDLALLVAREGPLEPLRAIDLAPLRMRAGPHPYPERPVVQRQDLAHLMLSQTLRNLPAAAAHTILHTAVRCHWDDATTTLLLQRGALLDAPSPTGCTPLQSAVQSSTRAVALLLAAGSNPALCDHAGQTALHTAARMSSVGPLQLLLRYGADVAARDNDGRTPLHVAAAYGRPKHFVVLLEYGARIGARDGDGLVPLELAALRRAVGSRLRKRVRLVRPPTEEAWVGLP